MYPLSSDDYLVKIQEVDLKLAGIAKSWQQGASSGRLRIDSSGG
jgi:hypothetical protein